MKKNNQLVVGSVVEQADALAIRHQEVMRYINVGRNALYDLLGNIYVLSKQIEGEVDKKSLIEGLKLELFNRFAIKSQKNTTVAALLVKYITKADRKTAHVYARAIETAKANNIHPENMKAYLEEKGGIEKIRMLGVKKEVSNVDDKGWLDKKENRVEFMYSILDVISEEPLASFEVDRKHQSRIFDQSREGEYTYMVCHREGSKFKALDVLPMSEELEDDLLDRLFKYTSSRSYYTKEEKELITKARGLLKTRRERRNAVLLEIEAEKTKFKQAV